MRIIYCIDNKLGGVSSLNYNLVANAPDTYDTQTILHIDCKEWDMAKSPLKFPGAENIYFEFSNNDNYYSTLKKLRQLIPDEPGPLIVNYENEMAMLDHYEVKKTVYQIVHDEYNLKLAIKYGHIVDVFISHNSDIYRQLIESFPQRRDDIYFLKHGVKVPVVFRKDDLTDKPIELLFLGRMSSVKGIFDLPEINRLLLERNVLSNWTCIGDGPELNKLKHTWINKDNVQFISPKSNDEVLEKASFTDVFVLPTKFEGSPVSLLETMSVGVVPVVTDLPGGIRDIVDETIGFRISVDNNIKFAEAISRLYSDRNLLNKLSTNCRNRIMESYDIKETALEYHELFANYKNFYRKKNLKKIKVGARLDHPLIPSFLTRIIRKTI